MAQYKIYQNAGYKDIQEGHYVEWARVLSGKNGYKLEQEKVDDRAGGITGRAGQTKFHKADLDETYNQCLALWQSFIDGRAQ